MSDWASWWFLNGGGIHRAYKHRQWTELAALANHLPKAAWDEQGKELDRLRARNAKLDRVREAASSVASEPEVMDLLTCYNMGVELIQRLAACDSEKAE